MENNNEYIFQLYSKEGISGMVPCFKKADSQNAHIHFFNKEICSDFHLWFFGTIGTLLLSSQAVPINILIDHNLYKSHLLLDNWLCNVYNNFLEYNKTVKETEKKKQLIIFPGETTPLYNDFVCSICCKLEGIHNKHDLKILHELNGLEDDVLQIYYQQYLKMAIASEEKLILGDVNFLNAVASSIGHDGLITKIASIDVLFNPGNPIVLKKDSKEMIYLGLVYLFSLLVEKKNVKLSETLQTCYTGKTISYIAQEEIECFLNYIDTQ